MCTSIKLLLGNRLLLAMLACTGLMFSSWASASVVITGTRVIYPSSVTEKTVQLSNQDSYPNVVQAWVDVNDPDSTPDKTDAPFLVTPPMFRMEPKTGQSLRLVYTGSGLPQDRESVFYLNVLQIPPRNEAYKDQSQMLVMLRNRLKLFYRPAGITEKPESVVKSLRFSLKQQGAGWGVEVENPTGYFASFSEGKLVVNGHETLLETSMVSPRSQAIWELPKSFSLPAGPVSIRCLLVNDYGAEIKLDQEVSR
ncbi:molecular chaperone [Pseudomonas sp. 30_B]|uniref:fimbrial biogenesis chaperone n=1 Tax=Pseudomonas sp. 30_B TaxID=2813575 RepID=UPI001FAECE1E|nr:molecular chaperone [Pseudomonas sp. 30_B]